MRVNWMCVVSFGRALTAGKMPGSTLSWAFGCTESETPRPFLAAALRFEEGTGEGACPTMAAGGDCPTTVELAAEGGW